MMTANEGIPVVLIVDDVPTNIKVLANALRHEYRVKVASRGEDALRGARLEPQPDLILLDVMMPEMDGYEVCRRLKSDPVTEFIPVIFITARDTDEDQELGFNLGCVDYITKPFSLPIAKARIRTHLRLKRQTDALERLSHIDQLTGLANRRQLVTTFGMEFKRAAREGLPLSVLIVDIDHFKDYNDHYGHGAGDVCLCQVALSLMKSLSRPGDLVTRYGGEEFVVLLPATNRADAYALGERLRENILQLNIPHAFSSSAPVVSVSIGGTTADTLIDADSPESLLERADKMLYRAKEMGRNRTVFTTT
ncbi:diguanylate cyclase (GGDEF) domain-containing protein [Thiocystis violascens DSM 198]|uniref:diguanylate cyclase n=2 Tax=Thiocystis violascens TaxID=73141 RepID=I3YFT4_THIV6|nr:diguanylate cyclase (GGDEF) domain-containing protein [Thiocystis violascens DSM 198]